MPELSSRLKKFKLSTKPEVLDSKGGVTIEKMRSKMLTSIDRHIERYINNRQTRNEEGKVQKVTKLSTATHDINAVVIFLKYGSVKLKIDGDEEMLWVSRQDEASVWEAVKEDMKEGVYDDELRRASHESSVKLVSGKKKN